MTLEQRIQRLEDIDQVKRTIAKAGRWFDRAEMTASADDAAIFYDSMFTKDGIMQFPFGTWGPDREQIIAELVNFSKDVNWSLHFYMNEEVDLNDELTEATYHAMEIIPITTNNKAQWIFAENESKLHKIDNEWKIHCYGLLDLKLVDNHSDQWPSFEKNEFTWMFAKS